MVETWSLLHHKLGRNVAERFWEGLRSGIAAIEAVGPADLEAAWEIGVSWRDQDFSIVDRTSFAVMRRLGIERVASLDEDFAVFRFGPKRRQSFSVIRWKPVCRRSAETDLHSRLGSTAVPQFSRRLKVPANLSLS